MSSHDLIGLAIIALLIIVALFGLNQISKPYGVKTEEEFQKRRQESPGLLNAAAMGLQQVLDPSAKKAVEVQQDLRRGIYDDKEEPDDPPEAGAKSRGEREMGKRGKGEMGKRGKGEMGKRGNGEMGKRENQRSVFPASPFAPLPFFTGVKRYA